MKKTLLSGVKPTGRPHIGNYFGAMKQFVGLQGEYTSNIFIANLHSLTSIQNKEEMEKLTLDLVIDYLAIGLDPKKVNIYKQSDVPQVTELAWIFDCLTTMPYLMRAHAFKDAEAKDKEINVGVFNYPILMAADILLPGADIVPVGKDQKQHVEIARDIAEKFNRIYGETFKLPKELILESVSTVPGIDGKKMSKSYGNTIPLFADDDEIKSAVMKIETDSKGVEESKDPETNNIYNIHKLLLNESETLDLAKRYREGGMGYKEAKDMLIEDLISFISPLRERREKIARNPAKVLKILKNGGKKANKMLEKKMKEVREKVGFR
ncbi:MAG: tryptophanyl-tRNA synthetase [Candidatus Paceibacteria bacterium]|jgi:tryptophanyl-tRNA synthetase